MARIFLKMTPALIVWILVLQLLGCTAAQKVEPPENHIDQLKQFISHRITIPGENLGLIALWYTGDVRNWRKCFIVAGSSINKLKTGDEIIIPVELVKATTPIPESFIQKYKPQNKNKPELADTIQSDSESEESWAEIESEFLDKIVPAQE